MVNNLNVYLSIYPITEEGNGKPLQLSYPRIITEKWSPTSGSSDMAQKKNKKNAHLK